MEVSKPSIRELLDELRVDEKSIRLIVRVERVLALHQPFKVYNTDDESEWCDETLLYVVCRECHTDDGVCLEDTENYGWPCPTVRALEGEE